MTTQQATTTRAPAIPADARETLLPAPLFKRGDRVRIRGLTFVLTVDRRRVYGGEHSFTYDYLCNYVLGSEPMCVGWQLEDQLVSA